MNDHDSSEPGRPGMVGYHPTQGIIGDDDLSDDSTINDIRRRLGFPITPWGELTLVEAERLPETMLHDLRIARIPLHEVREWLRQHPSPQP